MHDGSPRCNDGATRALCFHKTLTRRPESKMCFAGNYLWLLLTANVRPILLPPSAIAKLLNGTPYVFHHSILASAHDRLGYSPPFKRYNAAWSNVITSYTVPMLLGLLVQIFVSVSIGFEVVGSNFSFPFPFARAVHARLYINRTIHIPP